MDYDWDYADDFLASFDQSGNIKWSIPGYYAQIATADGGVIAQSYSGQSVTIDVNGNSTGQLASLPTQSWTRNAYQIDPVHAQQVVSKPTDNATSFWAQSGANPSVNSTASQNIVQNLYVRVFAPWYAFGPDPLAIPIPCPVDCFLGDNRTFTTSLGEGVTSRISGSVQLQLPAMAPISDQVYSNLTTARFRLSPDNKGWAHPTMTKTFFGNGNLSLHLSGADPLVPLAPNIDNYLSIIGSATTEQVCYSGQLSGDAFPNTEIFVINSKGQATTLLTFATTYDRELGPWTLLSPTIVAMGSFSDICVPY